MELIIIPVFFLAAIGFFMAAVLIISFTAEWMWNLVNSLIPAKLHFPRKEQPKKIY